MQDTLEEQTIAFIGAGNMSRAIISGLITAGFSADKIIAVNRSLEKNAKLNKDFSIKVSQDPISATKSAQIIVLGVKPQSMAELLTSMHEIDWQNKLVISIAAGVSVERLNELTHCNLRLIRVMPNTPSLIGEGMSGIYASKLVSNNEKQFAQQLFSAIGKTCWLENEEEINAVIAAAGSAPAYFFLFMQAMQEEAQNQGFDEKTARLLVQQAALGSAKLVEENPDLSLVTLREQVTSKGGATAEALKIFNQADLSNIVAKAMQAAALRAKEMESLF